MAFVDTVAAFIKRGYEDSASHIPGMTPQKLYKLTKNAVVCEHPIDKITLSFSVGVGDVLKPTSDHMMITPLGITMLLESTRLVVYSISNSVSDVELNGTHDDECCDAGFCMMLVIYNNAEEYLNLDNISAMVVLACKNQIMDILSRCTTVDNVRHRM